MSKVFNFKVDDDLWNRWYEVRKFSRFSLSEIVRERLEEFIVEEEEDLKIFKMGVEYGENIRLSENERECINMIMKSYSRWKNVDVKELVGKFVEKKISSRVFLIGIGEGVINNLNDEVVR